MNVDFFLEQNIIKKTTKFYKYMTLQGNPHDLNKYFKCFKLCNIPSIYLPFELRKNMKFWSLSRHKLRAQEKTWLCEFILKHEVSGSYGGAELSQIASQTILLDTISI